MSSAKDRLVEASDFAGLVGEEFTAREQEGGEHRADLVLARCRELGYTIPGLERKPFALEFKGPSGSPLDQRIYTLENPTFGTLDIFLVPIQETDGVRVYEAVFS